MTRHIITQDDRLKLEIMHGSTHGSTSAPANYRDASSTTRWTKPPTPIVPPSSTGRPQPVPKLDRGHNNPFQFHNTLPHSSGKFRGNPNVGQTLLSKPPIDSSPAEYRAGKRQRLDNTMSAGPAYRINASSSSHARGISRPSNAFEPEIQEVDHPNPVSNDAEIIIVGMSSEDIGEPVVRSVTSSSPDPMCLFLPEPPKRPHDFETHPKTGIPVSRKGKGKGRAASPVVVEGSEEDEIEEYPSPPPRERPSDGKTSEVIPKNIVKNRRSAYEGVSEPAAVRQAVQNGAPPLHLVRQNLVGGMKVKSEYPPHGRGTASPLDPVGTSSSHFTHSARKKEGFFSFPLDAWCFGHHRIQHSEQAPLSLEYERGSTLMRVISENHREFQFSLGRDVDSVKIVNDANRSLTSNVVIQFTSARRGELKKYKLDGFEAGGSRRRGHLTFLFSTAKERGFNPTLYQNFVLAIKKSFPPTAVESIRPTGGGACWQEACQYADTHEAWTLVRDDRSEAAEGERLARTRGTTPSSTSAKSQMSRSDSEKASGDMGPPIPSRRSARQSALRTVESSPPRLPPEPDELVLMYPQTGTGALSIMRSDIKRLAPEEYLNDTLIEFGLKLWLNDLREKDPALADQVHVFSSFFYKKLNNRKNPEEGYRSVRKWTSKVSLFSKKYVIVPINENIHWYLAVIYEPGHTLEPPLAPLQPQNTRMTRKRKQEQEHPEGDIETPLPAEPREVSPEAPNASKVGTEADLSSITATCASTPHITEDIEMADVPIAAFDKSCSISASKPVSATSSKTQSRDSSPLPELLLPASDTMEIDADSSVTELHQMPETTEITELSSYKASASNKGDNELADAPVVITEDSEDQQQEAEVDDMLAVPQSSGPNSPAQTYIFTLDSLGTRHPQAIKVLKHYLAQEAKDKHNFDEVREAIGKQVQVPVQPNSWDCGIYLLHFVKVFMSSPAEFVEQILSTRGTMPSSERKKRWQNHEIPLFRDNLIARISELSDEWKLVRGEEGNKRDTEDLSSEGEVDIVETPTGKVAGRKRRAPRPSGEGDMDIEEVPSGKAAPVAREKRPARRLRG